MTVPMNSAPVGARSRAMLLALGLRRSQSIARERAPTSQSTMSAE